MAGALPFGDGEDESYHADINVTPLVDVALVLLFIFMVTAPLLTLALKVQVPEVETARPATARSVVIVVGNEGSIAVDDRVVTLEQAVAEVLERTKPADDGTRAEVFLWGDKLAPYGFVLSVFDALQQAGIEDVNLVAKPLPSPEEARGRGKPQGARR